MNNAGFAPVATQVVQNRQVKGGPVFTMDTSGLADGQYALSNGAVSLSGMSGGSVVPKHTENGGMCGSDNPYGEYVKGHKFSGIDGKLPMTHKVPTRSPKAGVDIKNEEVLQKTAAAPALALVPAEGQIAQAQANLTPLPASKVYTPPAETSVEDNMAYLQSLATDAPAPAAVIPVGVPASLFPIERKNIRVRISGSKFGKYKGHYLHIVDDPNYLILFYDLDASGFEPPVTTVGEPITISCEDKEHKVYYMGMDFDLKMDNLGMQIYIKHQEN